MSKNSKLPDYRWYAGLVNLRSVSLLRIFGWYMMCIFVAYKDIYMIRILGTEKGSAPASAKGHMSSYLDSVVAERLNPQGSGEPKLGESLMVPEGIQN